MKRRALLLAACAALVGLGLNVQATEPVENKLELKTVEVINGASFKTNDIKAEYKIVLEGLKLPNATYQVDGSTLRIGVQLADSDVGRLLQVKQASDCPDNTQFRVKSVPSVAKKWDKNLKATLTAWTKHRHDDFSAKLRVINIRQLANKNERNFDVQLDLSRVSAVLRE